jgi:UDPglucose 6-dehydrogenase
MKLCVIGTGYVGLVSAACFAEIGHEVIGVDIDEEKVKRLQAGECPIYEPGLPELLKKHLDAGKITFTTNLDEGIHACPLIMAAVGTPVGEGRRADLSQVESVCRTIGQHTNEEKVFVMKSTVPVGTSKQCQAWVEEEMTKHGAKHHVHLVSNPEFLREGKAVTDFLEPDRIIVGFRDEKAGSAMRDLYKPLIDKGASYLEMDVESAELTKYASNAFLANKISFINFIADLCEASGANVEKVAEGMGLDKRIGSKFLHAGIGYGGSCFPKDVQALIKTAEELNIDAGLIEHVEEINQARRSHFVSLVEKGLGDVKGKTLAVWGLSFKPDTDDMRSAPSITIIEALQKKGAVIQVYDPIVKNTVEGQCASADETLKNADALLILTEWEEFKEWTPKKIAEELSGTHVFDGRNVFDPEEMKAAGLSYTSIGRS